MSELKTGIEYDWSENESEVKSELQSEKELKWNSFKI